MRHLRQNEGESAGQWLARLRRIDPTALPPHGRSALALSIGYARYLTQKEGRGLVPCVPPTAGGGSPPKAHAQGVPT
jgi:hypothetical protein